MTKGLGELTPAHHPKHGVTPAQYRNTADECQPQDGARVAADPGWVGLR